MSTRQLRRKNITVAPNLYDAYTAVCDYYKIPRDDASSVFNICLHTVAKALAERLKQEHVSQQATQTNSGTDSADSGKPT